MNFSNLQFIDISMNLENDVKSDPDIARPKIDYLKHDETVSRIQTFFPDLKAEELPDAAGWALEKIQLTTHNGTHLDAPYHFHPTMNHASGHPERSITIDEVPLDWCFRPGVKLDFRHFENGYVATANDVEAELKRIGHDLQPFDIVVVNTRAGKLYVKDEYVDSG